MHEQDRDEIEMLKRRQEAIQRHVSILAGDIEALSLRLSQATPPVPEIRPLEAPPLPDISAELSIPPGIIPAAEPVVARAAAGPPPLPPVIPSVVAQEASLSAEPIRTEAPPEVTAAPPRESRPRETFEMKV